MAKILVALEEKSSFVNDIITVANDFLPNLSNHLFVALVVKDLAYTSSVSAYMQQATLLDHHPGNIDHLSEEDSQKTEVIATFEKGIKNAKIRYQIYNDFRITAHELIKQTTYADLLILSYEIFFNHVTRKKDTSLLYEVLKGSRCPVLIVPENINPVKNIILTYDGKESSVFAIRAFSNLFDFAVKDKITTVLTVSPTADEEIKNEKLLMELVKEHFRNVGLQLLTGFSTSKEILNFADSVEDPLVVMGAYGRSTISNLIIPSVARRIIENRRIPLLIAHR